MSGSSTVSVSPRLPADYHFFAPSVEAEVIEAEYRRLLVAPWHSLPYGTALKYPKLDQLTKDVGAGGTRSALTRNTVRLTFAYQQLERPIDLIRAPFEYMLSVIASESLSSPYSVDEHLAIETQLQAETDPWQWKYATENHCGSARRRLIEKLRAYIRNAQQLLAKLEKEEHDEQCGRRAERKQ